MDRKLSQTIAGGLLLACVVMGITMWSCAADVADDDFSEYPRPGARSSEYIDGPYVLYADDTVKILRSHEVAGHMAVGLHEEDRSDFSKVAVHKAGFLPRTFEVEIKSTISSPPSHYEASDSIFAVSDIEGNFNVLINLLQQHGVINEQLDWSFGAGHFVLVGDVFDRGNHVTEMLWFLYRLEDQAVKQNGFVHYLMGNHDAMNLRGDLRYVEPKYTRFAELSQTQYSIDYAMLFGENSELGRWLRTKNVVEQIGEHLFVHAGISPSLSDQGYSLEKINDLAKITLATAKVDFTDTDALMWGKAGPFWYRGYFDINEERWGPVASQSDVETTLKHFGAEHIVVGHTHVEKPEFRYQRKVCAIDVLPPADHLIYVPVMPAYGIFIQSGTYFIADENGQLLEMVDQDI